MERWDPLRLPDGPKRTSFQDGTFSAPRATSQRLHHFLIAPLEDQACKDTGPSLETQSMSTPHTQYHGELHEHGCQGQFPGLSTIWQIPQWIGLHGTINHLALMVSSVITLADLKAQRGRLTLQESSAIWWPCGIPSPALPGHFTGFH